MVAGKGKAMDRAGPPAGREGQKGRAVPIDVSIVIPTLNGGRLFRDVLSGLDAQAFDGAVECVIIDSGSTDGTDRHAASHGWQVIRVDPASFNHGGTRNMAMARARGRYLVLMTQDAVPTDRFLLQNLVAPFTDPAIGGVCARQIPRPGADPVTRRNMSGWPASSVQPRVSRVDSGEALNRLPPHEQYMNCRFDNVCGAVRRTTWEAIPFPRNEFGEDLEWGRRVVTRGWKLCYQPKAVVAHSHDRSPVYEFKRAYCFAWQIRDLFGISNLPTIGAALETARAAIRADLALVFAETGPGPAKLKLAGKAALRTIAGALGQYWGTRDRGRSRRRQMTGI